MDKDLELWQKWKQSQDPRDLDALLAQFSTLVRAEMGRKYTGRVQFMTDPVIEHIYKTKLLEAFKHFDPAQNPGVPLGAYVKLYLKNVRDTVANFQNVAYVPPSQIGRMGEYQAAVEELRYRYGRDANAQELAEYLHWPIGEVMSATSENRKVVGISQTEADTWDSTIITMGSQLEQLRFLWHDLNDQERVVFEYLYGLNGKPKLGTVETARRVAMDPSKVSRIKKRIEKMLKDRQ